MPCAGDHTLFPFPGDLTMPQAIPVAARQAILERHRTEASLPAIAQDLGLSVWTVRTI